MKERAMPWWFRKRDDERHGDGSLKESGWQREKGAGRQFPVRPDDTVVSAVNDKLLMLLRKHMVPNVLASREEIGLCTPKDHGDMVFGIYLYDIRESNDVRIMGMQSYDNSHTQFPPIYLELYYMMTAYSTIDLRYREEENHRVLTKAMQVLYDYPRLEGEDGMHIEFQNLSMDQKSAVWHNLGGGYQLSLFYKIAPIKLESAIKKETSRVREIQIDAFPDATLGGGEAR